MKTVVGDAINRGVDATIDWDPINVVTDKTVLGGKHCTDLGEAPAPEEYEKSMWEAWIAVYAFDATAATIVRGGCMAGDFVESRVRDNVGKDLKEEMERVAAELAAKGIDASWLSDALANARARAEEERARENARALGRR